MALLRRALFLVAFTACAPSETPPPATPPVSAAPAVSAASTPVAIQAAASAVCLPATAAEAELFSSTLAGTTLTVCLRAEIEGAQGFPCVSVDTRTQAIASAPSVPVAGNGHVPPEEPGGLTTTGREVKVCEGEGKKCQTVRIGVQKPIVAGHGDVQSDALIAALSPDRATIAVLVPERVAGVPDTNIDSRRVSVQTYDLKGKRLSRTLVPPSTPDRMGLFSDHSDYWHISWLGPDHLLLSAHRCCGPAGSQEILDLKKGSFEPIQSPALFREVKKGVWLRGSEDHADPSANATVELTFMQLASGKRTRIALPGHTLREPETYMLEAHPIDGATWAVVHTSPPGVAWINVEQETLLAQVNLPLCR